MLVKVLPNGPYDIKLLVGQRVNKFPSVCQNSILNNRLPIVVTKPIILSIGRQVAFCIDWILHIAQFRITSAFAAAVSGISLP